MSFVFGTFIVPNAGKTAIFNVSQRLDRGNTDGMFFRGLSPTGNAPATHWISTGYVPAAYVTAITDPVRLFNAASAAYAAESTAMPYTQTQVTNFLAACDVSTDPPEVAEARVGVKRIP